MASDIRLSVEFFDHPKTIKMKRRLGDAGVLSLLVLWTWCRDNKPDGVLSGMDIEDIEIAARWEGEKERFVNESLTLRWIENNDGVFFVHDWQKHNPWSFNSETRANRARFSRLAKLMPEEYKNMVAAGINSITSEDYNALTNRQRTVNDSLTPAPAPAPAPSPAHNANKGKDAKKIFSPKKMKPDFFTDEDWSNIISHRKQKKTAETEKAYSILISEMKKAVDAGFSPQQCMETMIKRDWKGFECEWMINQENKKVKGRANGNNTGFVNPQPGTNWLD